MSLGYLLSYFDIIESLSNGFSLSSTLTFRGDQEEGGEAEAEEEEEALGEGGILVLSKWRLILNKYVYFIRTLTNFTDTQLSFDNYLFS